MPRKAPAEPIDHHYNIPKLNRVFTWTAILLTLTFVWMIWADYNRDWKTIQRVFFQLDAVKTRDAARQAREKAYGEERDRLIGELRAAREEMAGHRRSLARLQKRLDDLAPRIYLADQQYKFTKASFDSELYRYEDTLAHRPRSAPKARRDLDGVRKDLDRYTVNLAQLKKQEADAQEEIKKLTARQDEVRANIEKLTADYKLNRQKLAALRDSEGSVRNWPILDMINPSLRVAQVQLPEHFNDVNFMRIPRVDRCATFWIRLLKRSLPNFWLFREIFGLAIVGFYIAVLPLVLSKTLLRRFYEKMGAPRYLIGVTLALIMLALPIKMYLRWIFNLKYIVNIPEFAFNI